MAGISDPVVQTRILHLDPAERRDYVGLLDQLRTHIDMDVSGHTVRGGTTRMLQGILKLRLFCNNGFMGRDASKMAFDADEVLSCLQQTGQASCVLCSRTIYSISSVPETDGGCPVGAVFTSWLQGLRRGFQQKGIMLSMCRWRYRLQHPGDTAEHERA